MILRFTITATFGGSENGHSLIVPVPHFGLFESNRFSVLALRPGEGGAERGGRIAAERHLVSGRCRGVSMRQFPRPNFCQECLEVRRYLVHRPVRVGHIAEYDLVRLLTRETKAKQATHR